MLAVWEDGAGEKENTREKTLLFSPGAKAEAGRAEMNEKSFRVYADPFKRPAPVIKAQRLRYFSQRVGINCRHVRRLSFFVPTIPRRARNLFIVRRTSIAARQTKRLIYSHSKQL
jgi:hypothetical protein